jgi:hypothetical protein
MIATGVLGLLPSLDFVDPHRLKIVSFSVMLFILVGQKTEAFFDKTVALFQTGHDPDSTDNLTPTIKVSTPAASPVEPNKTTATNITVEQTTKDKQ